MKCFLPRFFIVLLMVGPLRVVAKQRKPISEAWKALAPAIDAVLAEDSEFKACPKDSRWVEIVQTADVTGDGVDEALVQFCRMGAYTSIAALMRLEQGKPVKVGVRRKNGSSVEFLQGASVRHGTDAKLLPEKNAVYEMYWNADESGTTDCDAEAFVWVAKSATFEPRRTLSKDIVKNYCPR
jgi:hypothetical protein